MNMLLILSALFAALTGAIGSVRIPEARQVEAVAAVAVRTAQAVAPTRLAALPLPTEAYGTEHHRPAIAVPSVELRQTAAIRGERRHE